MTTYINGIYVGITDIQKVVNKQSQSYDILREDSPLAFATPYGVSNFVMSCAFDLSNSNIAHNALAVISNLYRFPFCWIESEFLRKSSYLKDINGQYMFAVESITFKMDSKVQGVLFMTVTIVPVEHTAIINDFSFISIRPLSDEDKWKGNTSNQKLVYDRVRSPQDSDLFQSYFGRHIDKAKDLHSIAAQLGKGFDYLAVSMPVFFKSYEEASIAYSNSVDNFAGSAGEKPVFAMSRARTDGIKIDEKESDIADVGHIAYVNSVSINSSSFPLQSFTLTVRNKLAVNHMQGYVLPFIQYMGKEPSELQLEYKLNANNSGSKVGVDIIDDASPHSFLTGIFSSVDINAIQNRDFSAYRSLRFISLLNMITDSQYFQYDKEVTVMSAEEQGVVNVYYNFIESDLRGLREKLTAKKVKFEAQYDNMKLVLSVLQNVNAEYMNSTQYRALRKEIEELNNKRTVRNFVSNVTFGLVDDSIEQAKDNLIAADELANVLFRLQKNLHDYLDLLSKKVYNKPRDITSGDNLLDLTNQIKYLSGIIIDGSISIDGVKTNVYQDINTRIINYIMEAFNDLLYMAKQNNKFASPYMKSVAEQQRLAAGRDRINITGEAIPDLHIGESVGDLPDIGNINPQRVTPFFFMSQQPYIDSKTIYDEYDRIASSIDTKLKEMSNVTTLSSHYDPNLLSDKKNIGEFNADNVVDLSTQPVSYNVPKNRAKVASIIKECVAAYNANVGVDKQLDERMMLKMAELESSYEPQTRRRNEDGTLSRYCGLYQLDTSILQKYGYLGKWNDARSNTECAIAYITKDVIPQMQAKKIKINTATLYLSFQQGVAGFSQVYDAAQNNKSFYSLSADRQKAIKANNIGAVGTPIEPAAFLQKWYKRIGVEKSTTGASSASKSTPASLNSNVKPANTVTLDKGTVNETTAHPVANNDLYDNEKSNNFINPNPIEQGSSKIFEGMKTKGIDIFNDRDQAQYRALRTGKYFETGLNLLIPTIKVYLVEGNENDLKEYIYKRKRNLIELYGFADVRVVTPTEDDPVAVCTIEMLNPLSAYTDHIAAAGLRMEIDPSKLAIGDDVKIKSTKMIIAPGSQLQVRMGYSNDPNDLEVVFNGEVTEMDAGEYLSIIAEGYGRELVAIKHSQDEPRAASGKINSSTSGIIDEIMRSQEIMHFGANSSIINDDNPYAKSIMKGTSENDGSFFRGKFQNAAVRDALIPVSWTANSERVFNVYSPSIEEKDDFANFGWGNVMANLFSLKKPLVRYFPVYNAAPWDVLSEMQYRHPNTRVQVLNYDERATFFFGIKEQLYYSGSVSNDMITRASREVASAYVNDSMVDSDRYATLKPVSDFHIATSANNILSNEIKLDATFSSAVSIRYFDDTPDLEDYSTNEDFKWYEMQLDDNLLPTAIRSSELIKLGVDHMDMAWRYGQAALRKSAEQMYSGRITVIGNPYIKAGDFMFIHDDTRKMTGVIKVRECIHHFNSANGFVTEITPGLYVEEAMFTFSTLMTKLTSVYANIVSRMHTDTIYSYMPKNKFMQTKMLYELATNQFGASNKSELDYLSKILIFGGSFLGLGWPTEMVLGRFTTLTMAERAAGFTKILAATGADVARIVHGSAELAMKIGKYAINNTPIKDLAAVSKAAVSSIRNVKSASELAALAKNAFNGAKGFGYMAAKLKSFVSVARSSNMLAVAALNPASLLFGIAFGVVLSFAFDTIDEIGATRQPIRMFPLTTNGRPFVAGIAGMRDNTYWESKIEEFGKTLRAGEKTAGFVSEMFFGDQSPIGETARDILAYQTTRLKEGL